ncbi:pathogenicity island protein [Staphylococcus petrasii]|jgi:hypothetical protein|uniref:pathogenicity island protein n=1 Tax=Staphylococcus petrasii TaxID=1276936 RepID=UPI003F664FE4
MNKRKVKEYILDYIKRNPETTFIEIEEVFKKLKFNYKGKGVYCSGESEKVIFWADWNKKAFDVVSELKRDGYVIMNVVSPTVYLLEGKTLDLPVMKTIKDLKQDCWIPVTFTAIYTKAA